MDVHDHDRDHEQDGADGAERAFEALRGEVLAQRAVLERIASRLAGQGQQQDQAAADYSPTLGAIAKELHAVGARLDRIDAHPALSLTPADHARQLAAGLRQTNDETARTLAYAGHRLDNAEHALREVIGSANAQFEQQRREWIAVAAGAVLGLVLWYPLVWFTPWSGGDWLAATLIGGGRWGAGETLLREADPVTWERMVRLYQACPQASTTQLCAAAMAVRTPAPSSAGVLRARPGMHGSR